MQEQNGIPAPGESAAGLAGRVARLPRTVFIALLAALVSLGVLAGACAFLLTRTGPETAISEEPSPAASALEAEAAPAEAEAEETEPEETARLLPVSLSLGEERSLPLLDGDYRTDLPLRGEAVTVRAEEEIAALYLIWGDYPEAWELEAEGTRYREGENGFLHELVLLESPADSLTIHTPAAETRLCDLYAYGAGSLPDEVQRWERPGDRAELLLFSTHADDELVFFGGLIPYYAQVCGKSVQVVYMTTNYYDEDDYRLRPHEALNGLWTAGARLYPVTNMQPDHICWSVGEAEKLYDAEQFLAFQVEQIRRFRPEVIVTQDHDGEYGHGVHQLAVRTLERAVEAAADSAQFPESAAEYGVWDTPKTYLHLYGPEEERTVLNYETPAETLGWRSPFEIARLAYEKHETQQKWDFEVYGYESEYDSHSFGLYRSLVGQDEERRDLFEHLP